MSHPQHLPSGVGTPQADGAPLVARTRFPLLRNQPDLVYLDSAASAQKPDVVIDRLTRFYTGEYANIHRGLYPLSEIATENYDAARTRVARFLNAGRDEVIFTHNATEGTNLVAHAFGDANLRPGDLILTTLLEHHANIVPWQLLKERRHLRLAAVPIDAHGDLDLERFEMLLSREPKLVCVTAAANTIGTVTPLKEIVAMAHRAGALVMVDAAQAAPHFRLDVRDLDCDFLTITGHKLYGPDGIGALYVKEKLLADLPPFMGGGGIIRSVSIDHTDYAAGPRRFEAGTPAIGAAIALATALDFIDEIGFGAIAAHDAALTDYAAGRLAEISGLKILGRPQHRIGILSFTLDGIHPHDIGTLLGESRICIRAGHHCAQPLMEHFGVTGTARASFGVHNTTQDVDRLVDSLARVRQMLR
ncbi:aminotransferase class V-fold PLP-dependent enzyme [Dongia rigui]|uniref:Cysteine desulfurase n=1 Tax=Dongia rigui TaxID=940149 RepID=A0ABU5DV62_9PROT|nr:cysteine desulfurase [Dongia rigui]MDY0871214.1 cysteine desulfurase [Dongia rigui]